jgi:hypothetical protein
MGIQHAADVQAEDFAPTGLCGMILIPEEWRGRARVAHRVAWRVVAIKITAQSPRLGNATRPERKQKPCKAYTQAHKM